jgi:hypothetical protein
MNVQSNQRAGIRAVNVSDLTLDHVQSFGNGLAASEPAFEGDRVHGTVAFTASIFKTLGESALYLHDSSGGSTSLTFTATNCTFFNGTSSTSLTMGDAVDLFPSGANNVSYTFTGSSFTGAYRDLFHLEPIGTSTVQITLTNNTFNGYGNAAMTGRGISIFNGTPLGSNNIALPFDGSITYTIANNQITGTAGDAITVGILGLMSTAAGATASGTITGNTIGNPNDQTFNATTGGIYIFNDGADVSGIRGTHSVRIENNLVQHARNGGLAVYAGPNGGAVTNLKIYSNTFLDFDATSAMDIRVSSSGSMGDAEQLCLDFGGGAHPNTIVLPLFGTEDIYLWRQYDAMAFLPGYTGAPNDYFAVSQFLGPQNNGSGGVTLGNPPGPGGFYNVGSCPTP